MKGVKEEETQLLLGILMEEAVEKLHCGAIYIEESLNLCSSFDMIYVKDLVPRIIVP